MGAAGIRTDDSEDRALAEPRTAAWPSHLVRLLAFFLIVVGIQYASAAFRDGFSSYPDEPNHYITSLMMRDFFAAGLPLHGAARFAQDFYLHYPKVALGHWPPVGYCIYGFWMLLFGTSRVSALLGEALLTACCAFMIYRVARLARMHPVTAYGLAIAFLLLPIVQAHYTMLMLEVPLTLFSLAAALSLKRLLDCDQFIDGILFGLLASLSIMTKGNGWALALMPPIAILLTGKYRRALSPRLWLGAAITAVVCVPYTIWSLPMVKDGWEAGAERANFFSRAIPRFGAYLFTTIGPVLSVCLLAGLFAKIVLPLRRKEGIDTVWAVMLSLVLSVWLFHAIVPSVIDPRYLVAAMPALLLFAGAGIEFAVQTWPSLRQPSRATALAAVLGAAFVLATVRIDREYCTAMNRAADFLLSKPEFRGAAFCISSVSDGEGRLIAEFGEREVWPGVYAVRATKLIAKTNWRWTDYKLRYSTPEQVTAALADIPIGVVIVHNEAWRPPQPHHSVIQSAMNDTSKWQKIYSDSSPCTRHQRGEQVEIYQYRLAPIRKPMHLDVDLENKINRTLKLKDLEKQP